MPPSLIASLLHQEPILVYLHKLLQKVHNGTSKNHGFQRTLRMLTTPTSTDSTVILCDKHVLFLRSHIRQFIALCPCCQKMSMIKPCIAVHPYTTSRYYPMECLNIDDVGPYPDKSYVFVIIDTFTKWVDNFTPLKLLAKVLLKPPLPLWYIRSSYSTSIVQRLSLSTQWLKSS